MRAGSRDQRTTSLDRTDCVAEPGTDPSDPAHEIIVERLSGQFPTVPSADIRTIVEVVARSLQDARITQYVPILVERLARDELARRADQDVPA